MKAQAARCGAASDRGRSARRSNHRPMPRSSSPAKNVRYGIACVGPVVHGDVAEQGATETARQPIGPGFEPFGEAGAAPARGSPVAGRRRRWRARRRRRAGGRQPQYHLRRCDRLTAPNGRRLLDTSASIALPSSAGVERHGGMAPHEESQRDPRAQGPRYPVEASASVSSAARRGVAAICRLTGASNAATPPMSRSARRANAGGAQRPSASRSGALPASIFAIIAHSSNDKWCGSTSNRASARGSQISSGDPRQS